MTTFAEIFPNRPLLADGAMGTVLYARGIFINRCYEELNLSDPGLILSVHEEYLQAGAEILETNTFGANPIRLARYGLADKATEINAAGVRLARQAVENLSNRQGGEAWVAGSVGPLGVRLEPLGRTGLDEARAAFADQMCIRDRHCLHPLRSPTRALTRPFWAMRQSPQPLRPSQQSALSAAHRRSQGREYVRCV